MCDRGERSWYAATVQQGPGPRPFDVSGSFLVELDPPGWLDWIGLPVEGPVQSIESDVGTVLAEVDKVLRIEASRPWLAHIELQANHDPELPFRLLEYHALLLRRHKIRVETTLVLLRPSADDLDLNGRFEQAGVIHEITATLRYRVLRLWETPVEELLSGGLGVAMLAPLGKVEPAEVPAVMRRMDERASREVPPSRLDELRTATRFLLGLRYDRDQILAWMQGMSWVRESSLWHIAVDEGRELGRVDEARRLILELGAERLGPPDTAARDTVERIADLERLERLIRRVFAVSTWQELLADA
jgi:hypothetical protein